MSNYRAKAFNPVSKRVEDADYCDNYYGRHRYGIRFDDGCVHPEAQCGIDAAATQLDALLKEREALSRILSECAAAIGNGAAMSPECSLEFMTNLPAEIAAHADKLRRFLKCSRDEGTEALERATRAEQERDGLETQLDVISASHRDLASRLAAMGQERDEALAALKPFADIAPFVEYTDLRDGEVVHRQSDRSGNKVELRKDDFRLAARRLAGPDKEGK